MSAHSKQVIDTFCELCIRLHQSYQMRKYLFDENPQFARLKHPHHEHFFFRLSEILQEHWLHQLAKLHDPAGEGDRINLSIDYMIKNGEWDENTESKLNALSTKMAPFAASIKGARNKLLSHNDLAVLLRSTELGAFEQGADEEYFQCLEQFASIVRGDLFVFDHLVRNDVDVFTSCFVKGLDCRPHRE